MKRPLLRNLQWLAPITGAAALLLALFLWSQQIQLNFGRPALFTGWWLFAVMIFLSCFNARKKLSMLPLGRASVWLRWHVIGGFLTLALFWLHTHKLWPTGLYERALAASFYLLNLSGIIGWLLQKIYPRQLTDTGGEIIYERIPSEIARLRESAEAIALDCTRETGSDTLARHYLETLHWFFLRPRFFANHALSGGKNARAWLRQQCTTVRSYLNEAERGFLDRLTVLAEQKADVDAHYAAQALMKRWLLVHLPLVAVTMLLVFWHIILVFAYAQ